MQPADPVKPQRVFWELSPRLPDGAILTSDSGSCANWYARDLKIRRGMMASLSGGLASMGAAVPYAIAAKLAHPRSEEHTSELQSLMRISYAVFCLNKKKTHHILNPHVVTFYNT